MPDEENILKRIRVIAKVENSIPLSSDKDAYNAFLDMYDKGEIDLHDMLEGFKEYTRATFRHAGNPDPVDPLFDTPPEAPENNSTAGLLMIDEEPRKVDIKAPLSVDTIYQLINGSIQSGKRLWLPGANLSGAILNNANLWKADLSDADLRRADLRGADLSEALLGGADLTDAKYDTKAKWPEGFDPKAAGAVLVEDDD